jgi:dihydroneopterin aldolase
VTIGTTGLKNLRIDCVVGVYDHERATPQPVLFDIELDYDFAAAAGSDAIGDAMDYDRAATAVTALVQERQFALLESMAEAVAAHLLDEMPPVQTVRLEIRKPQAVPAAAGSFVRVERTRG